MMPDATGTPSVRSSVSAASPRHSARPAREATLGLPPGPAFLLAVDVQPILGGPAPNGSCAFGCLGVTHRPGEPLRDLPRRDLVVQVHRIYVLVEQDNVAVLVGRDDDAGHSSLSSWSTEPAPRDWGERLALARTGRGFKRSCVRVGRKMRPEVFCGPPARQPGLARPLCPAGRCWVGARNECFATSSGGYWACWPCWPAPARSPGSCRRVPAARCADRPGPGRRTA